ncbi:BatA domain-containing protein [Pseudotenacibaculum sp. MALMAid0570]|uniref:BatA domain-containing protein n=1 Tax=Pseudotenacibaculum sp. MALMAid0570 TaxID=3143938 RepID=UPI0032DE6860
MQFKHPEIFYLLLLLIIPILVHLFQLQKFKKIAFTNVAFLKKISLETRKSSRVKKWLILTTRILGLLALLFVFSQPYFSSKKFNEKNHNLIYLDNSMSLNTNGNNGNELMLAAQEIIENASDFDTYTLATNDHIYEDINKNQLSELLKNIKVSSKFSNIEQKILEFENKIKNTTKTLYNIVLISDFQIHRKNKKDKFTNVNSLFSFIKIDQNQKNNVSIDSIYISNNNSEEIKISVTVRNQGEEKNNIPIALYNDEQLINKRSFSIEENNTKNIEFSIPKTTKFNGKIQVTFNDIFLFDNTFFFSINSQEKINILSIGETSNSLRRVFTESDFNFSNSTLQNVNFNSIPNQQLIILNQLENITNALQNSLVQFLKDGGHLLIIPNEKSEIASYNTFFRKFANGSINNIKSDSLKITNINYDHPLYTNVFSKKVTNFQYPSVSRSYSSSLKGDKIISFENKTAFLQEVDNSYTKVYWFSSPLNIEITNFSNSPLIVPTLYNIGQQSLQTSKPYYILQKENVIEVNQKLSKDQILKISNTNSSFIPLQQSFSNKVRLLTNEQPKTPGFYTITLDEKSLTTIAYNVNKEESSLLYYTKNELKSKLSNLTIYDSIEGFFTKINQKNEVQWLWKLFLAIAIVSLLLEILILKFFRT